MALSFIAPKASMDQAIAIDKYIADNNLQPWEPKSYEKANHAVHATIPAKTWVGPPTARASSPSPTEIVVWFDEALPAAGAALLEVVITPRAYDGAIEILRKSRQDNTSVQAGVSIRPRVVARHLCNQGLSAMRRSIDATSVSYTGSRIIVVERDPHEPAGNYRPTPRRTR